MEINTLVYLLGSSLLCILIAGGEDLEILIARLRQISAGPVHVVLKFDRDQ